MAEGNHGVSIQPFPSRNNAQRGACRARLAGTATLVVRKVHQVVPHEVAGMANYTKNLFVGTVRQ
jgi:hypothetical protein